MKSLFMKQRYIIALFLIVITVLFSVYACKPKAKKTVEEDYRILKKSISSPDGIVSIELPYVAPITYTNVVSLEELPLPVKKKKFFDMILPSILISKQKLRRKQATVRRLMGRGLLSEEEAGYLARLRKEYRASDNEELISKLEPHPTSIILAQAAIETGWGSSRFFLEANNVFGIWSFDQSEARLQAEESRDGRGIYIKKYDDLISSIDDYFKTLARGPYQTFRERRVVIDNPLKLIEYLDQYSELRGEYVSRLRAIITHNKLQKFDNCVLRQTGTG